MKPLMRALLVVALLLAPASAALAKHKHAAGDLRWQLSRRPRGESHALVRNRAQDEAATAVEEKRAREEGRSEQMMDMLGRPREQREGIGF